MGTGKIQTTAFNIFVAMIKEHKELPFEIKIPNKETQKVINDSRKGKNLIPISDTEELRRII
jgi:DNA-damage-inducible protein J